MKNDKTKNIIIVSLVIIIIILGVLLGLVATEKISFKGTNYNDGNKQNAENIENNESNQNVSENDGTINNNHENEIIEEELGKYDTFSISNESGIVEVIGYPEVKEISGGEMYPGEKENYIYFHIKETKSSEFKKYIESLKGNAFAIDDGIGLGCLVNNKIKYSNESDKIGFKEYELSQEDSSKILNATENNPIKLKLERLPLSAGKGAPLCYSHITKIEIK